MVLPNPASPATTMPETSASRTMTELPSSAQPSHQDVREAGPCRTGRPGPEQQRITVQAAQPDQARPLLLGPHADTAPGVSQVAGGPLVVGQASAGDGGHGGGHALVVERRTRPSGSGAGGSTDPGSRGRGSGRAGATRPPTAAPAGSAPGRRPAQDAGGPGERAAAGPAGQPTRVAVPPTRASSSDSPTRVASISAPPLPGPQGSAAPGDQQPVTAALDQLPVAVVGQVGQGSGYASRSRTPGSRGCRPTSAATPSTTAATESAVGRVQQGAASSRRAAGGLGCGAVAAGSKRTEASAAVRSSGGGCRSDQRDDDPRLMRA